MDRTLLTKLEFDQDSKDAFDALRAALKGRSGPQAIVCDGDANAFAAERVLKRLGLKIPTFNFADSKASPHPLAVKPMAKMAEAVVELLDKARSRPDAVTAMTIPLA
jgi:DNA-binding LacI/PurR family transcriptional regulator